MRWCAFLAIAQDKLQVMFTQNIGTFNHLHFSTVKVHVATLLPEVNHKRLVLPELEELIMESSLFTRLVMSGVKESGMA